MVYQAQVWGWGNAKTLGLGTIALVLLCVFPVLERKAPEPVIPQDLMRNREFLTLCLSSVSICQLFFIVLLYFTQYAMKFLGDDPMRAGLRVVPFMLSYGIVSYFGGPLYARFGARILLTTGMISAIISSIMLAIRGPGASWLPYNGALILLGIGVGAVIPNISARAIETVGVARAGLVSGITFMAQLSGSALMLAVGTAIFTAVSSSSMEKQFLQEGMALSESQWQAVAQVMSGPRTVHGLSPQTLDQIKDLAGILSDSYRAGLQAVLWVSAGLVGLTLFLVLRYVPRKIPAPGRSPSVPS
jgi:Na+/melibiose symporter-like transporter